METNSYLSGSSYHYQYCTVMIINVSEVKKISTVGHTDAVDVTNTRCAVNAKEDISSGMADE